MLAQAQECYFEKAFIGNIYKYKYILMEITLLLLIIIIIIN